jgi:hypothetical protein
MVKCNDTGVLDELVPPPPTPGTTPDVVPEAAPA